MRKLPKSLVWLICFFFIAQMAAPAVGAQNKGAAKANAADLVKSADRAVAAIVKLSRDSKDKAMSMENKNGEPYWQALKKLNEAIDKVGRGLTLKDETFFTSIASATSAVEELKVTFGMSGAKDQKVKAGIEKVDKAVSLLREHYSKESSRLKKGDSLTGQEKQQLETIKDKQAELQRKLTELEGKVGKNETLIKGIKEIRDKSHQVSTCNNDVAGFVFAMTAMNIINGWVWGWHWWWGPWGGWWPGFSVGFVDIYIDVIHVIDYDWIVVDDMIDVELYDLAVEDALVEEIEREAADQLIEEAVEEAVVEEVEMEAADRFLEEGNFDVTEEEAVDFSADELQFEGEMDIIEPDDFEDPGMGDFSFD